MRCFPQLLTGALCQYPIRKRRYSRTVVNRFLDGREIKLADGAGGSIEWQLSYQELSDEEATLLQSFFLDMEGNLQPFTFLDPTDNLLSWSEKFDEATWQRDGLLQLYGGLADPNGGTGAFRVRNAGGAGQKLRQTLNLPAGNYYSFSVWARAAAGKEIRLMRGLESCTRSLGASWERLVFAASSNDTGTTVEFAIELPPGATIDLFGAQVEAQIGASGYKKTTSAGGVHTNTRFAEGGLLMTATAPGRNGCLIRLRTN
jgi:hypothetical protein